MTHGTPTIGKKIIPETACRCGGKFFVATVEGVDGPRTFHTNPVCQQADKLVGIDFLKWVQTGEEPPAPPSLNRRMRRRMAAMKRQT